jgi:hypothetical protein
VIRKTCSGNIQRLKLTHSKEYYGGMSEAAKKRTKTPTTFVTERSA